MRDYQRLLETIRDHKRLKKTMYLYISFYFLYLVLTTPRQYHLCAILIGHDHLVLINKFKDVYGKILTWKGFLQLQMLPGNDAIKTSATKIKEVTKINTICSVLIMTSQE